MNITQRLMKSINETKRPNKVIGKKIQPITEETILDSSDVPEGVLSAVAQYKEVPLKEFKQSGIRKEETDKNPYGGEFVETEGDYTYEFEQPADSTLIIIEKSHVADVISHQLFWLWDDRLFDDYDMQSVLLGMTEDEVEDANMKLEDFESALKDKGYASFGDALAEKGLTNEVLSYLGEEPRTIGDYIILKKVEERDFEGGSDNYRTNY